MADAHDNSSSMIGGATNVKAVENRTATHKSGQGLTKCILGNETV